ncbi:hypothetical protein KOW79_003628 [Hemibagrus wyckioides]|uniref:Receptor ligand binding region domain-containing protein n=1 Tax=Hemibagrus wyckioides TaxID=337641 RepID=A0A9D3P5Z4_9TELE|nr:hypothetical protein KOW79_003628 [Hemibagrus wyckioides]
MPPTVNCMSLDFRAFQYSQSLIFATEEINNSSSLLPGVSLGYKIYDTCGTAGLGVKVAMALINGNENSVSEEICTKPAQVQAIIGETYSSVSMAIAKSIGPFSMPLVSLDFRAFQYSQSLIFATEEINNSSSLLPGVSLGYKIYDTCGTAGLGVKVAMALINGNENSVSDEICTKPAQVQAIIGENYSSVSMAIAKSIGPFSMPLVSLDYRAFQYSQSLIFATEEINNSSSLLPGVSLGYKIYDTCGTAGLGVKMAMALINGNENSVSEEICTKPAQVQAIIGENYSSVSMAIAKSIGPFSMPLISYFATCECLSDKRKYPSFLRTIPSDYYQSRALAEMVKHFGWTWVGAIRRDDDYGNNGMATFTKVAEQLGICLEYSLPFYGTYSKEKVLRIAEQIKSSTSRVIVGFLTNWDLEILVRVFSEHNITGYQWVGTEGWIADPIVATLDKHNILQGAIGLAIPKTKVAGLEDFILDIKPLKSVGSAIFTKFWESLFKCKYTVQNDSGNSPVCTGKEKLSEMDSAFTDMSLMPIFSNVYKGVYAIAHTLHDLLGCKETCPTKKQPDPFTVS